MGGSPHLSISVTKKLLDEHRQGKLTEKDLYSKMVVERSKEAAGNDTQFKVFEAALTQKLALLTPKLQAVQDSDVMILWAPDMYPSPESGTSYVPGFGLTLQLSVDVPVALLHAPEAVVSGRVIRRELRTTTPSGEFQADDSQVDSWQKAARESLRSSMIVYGRTLRSLKEEELLRVILNSPSCESCTAPARTIFTVKAGVLKAYDAGTLALPGALNEVQIQTEGKASQK
ncbi:MAG: hypothetical protein EAZ89_02865 [Bacteroidetes bacterium]|nr:MAG: hypothetical protein EAZ89_02865 [Bacteroidota bacterium]